MTTTPPCCVLAGSTSQSAETVVMIGALPQYDKLSYEELSAYGDASASSFCDRREAMAAARSSQGETE